MPDTSYLSPDSFTLKPQIMFKNYFKTALRNFEGNKTFSFINMIGLAVGLTCFVLIAFFVNDELSYDTYPADAKDKYRVHEK